MKEQDFFDEQIIDLRNQEVEKQNEAILPIGSGIEPDITPENRTIYTGVKIMDKWIFFERRMLWKEKVSMMIPQVFKPMKMEDAKLKYPSEHRPEIILTDESGTINLLFQEMAGEVTQDGLEDLQHKVFGMMKRVNQGIKQISQGVEEQKEGKIAYVEFSNPTLDGKLYNLMFFIEIEQKPYMCSFNCRTKEVKYWKSIANEMMKSIQIEVKSEK